MADGQRHRGPHPIDRRLFAPEVIPLLGAAVGDLAWLLGRGYSTHAALKLVGDHASLRERQRMAVLRSSCSAEEAQGRQQRRLAIAELAGRELAVDGFNCLITSEAALAGGVLLRGRDGALRDLASVHGSYHGVRETPAALAALGHAIMVARPREVRWFLDRPVSNSGRLRALLLEHAAANGWSWQVEVVNNPDRAIAETGHSVASTDAWLLDTCPTWVCLADEVVRTAAPDAWIVDLSQSAISA